jgi:hypothetical protein
MAFRAEIIKYNHYKHSNGAAYKIFSKEKEKEISLVVTERGGRILSLKRHGHEVMWSNPRMFKKLPEILQRGKEQGREHVTWDDVNTLGGEKTLIAPQDLYDGKVPFLEPNLGLFKSREIEGGVELASPICSESGIQIFKRIFMTKPSTFEIETFFVNFSNENINAAPWIVFQLPVPADVRLQHLVGAPEAFKVFGDDIPAGILNSLGNTSFSLSLKNCGKQFKAGYNFPCNGKSDWRSVQAYFPKENTMINFEIENIKGPFPHGYRMETYGDKNYFEQEFLGVTQLLTPGQVSETLKARITLSSMNG